MGIERIFSAPYHLQSNGKLEVFHKYLKPTLKKLCEEDPSNWDKYINQVLANYRVTPNLATAEMPFFLDHLLGYYLCLNTCWKTLEVLKTKKYYYFHMTNIFLTIIPIGKYMRTPPTPPLFIYM